MDPQAATSHAAPDWQSISDDVLCPLCEYNLRGVSEARCPECGYRFDWPEVLDPNRRLHRYLFEHHPERSIWSFRKTLTGSLLPRRFWRSLHPVQPVNPARLRRYWLVVAAVFFLCIQVINIGAIGLEAVKLQAKNAFEQTFILRPINPASPPAWVMQQYGSYENLKSSLESQYPTQMGWPLIKAAISQWSYYWKDYEGPLVFLLWPWFTFGALLVFRWSMRRAKIRPAHVLRCVVYSSDGLVWAGLASAALFLTATALHPWPGVVTRVYGTMSALDVAIGLHVLYRLVAAYRLYLRFDHPILTILASQIIAGLAIIKTVALFTIDLT